MKLEIEYRMKENAIYEKWLTAGSKHGDNI